MIEDDADPETLDAWYRRSPEDIEAERAARWNAAWQALRLPEHLAREPDVIAGGTGDDVLMGGAGSDAVKRRVRGPAPTLQSWTPYQRALLDTIASSESPDYDVLYSPVAGQLRRLPRLPNGEPDYRAHPKSGATISNGRDAGKTSTAAGRYQILGRIWDNISTSHKDLTDFSPGNQDKAAWYLAWERYARTTGRDLNEDLQDPKNYAAISSILRNEWTSLPGGIQQGQTQSEFDRRMSEGLKKYQTPPPR